MSDLPVSNKEIDALMVQEGNSKACWEIPPDEVARVRGRVYYSARIHGVEVKTSYAYGRLAVGVYR